MSYELEVKNKGGHSCRFRQETTPSIGSQPDSIRLSEFNFPLKFNDTTRAYFEFAAEWEGSQLAADIRSVISGKRDPAALSFVRL